MARLWSSKTPDKTALLDGGRVASYAQLDHRFNRIANTLLAAVCPKESIRGLSINIQARLVRRPDSRDYRRR
jgi:hypothetical protein